MQIVLAALLALGFTSQSARAETPAPLHQAAVEATRTAAQFLMDSVAEEGGYLWAYSADLSLREGEFHPALNTRRPPATQVWVQPPGTPSVGMALLELWEATGIPFSSTVHGARPLLW